jgi:hypothetical protein
MGVRGDGDGVEFHVRSGGSLGGYNTLRLTYTPLSPPH